MITLNFQKSGMAITHKDYDLHIAEYRQYNLTKRGSILGWNARVTLCSWKIVNRYSPELDRLLHLSSNRCHHR